MICLVEDIVNADTRNKFKHFAYGKGVSSIQVYYAIARSILIARIISCRLEAAVEVHAKGISLASSARTSSSTVMFSLTIMLSTKFM